MSSKKCQNSREVVLKEYLRVAKLSSTIVAPKEKDLNQFVSSTEVRCDGKVGKDNYGDVGRGGRKGNGQIEELLPTMRNMQFTLNRTIAEED